MFNSIGFYPDFFPGTVHRYPYGDMKDCNLNWLISEVLRLREEMNKYSELDAEIKELEALIKDYTAMIDAILGKDLVDDANYNLKYQVIPDNNRRFDADITASGFCIGSANGRPVAMNCFIDGADNNVTVVFTYMDDGSRLSIHTGLPWGHANSCCYCPETQKFYVACAASNSTGRRTLLETDLNGSLIHETQVDGQDVWAVTCANGYLYCLTEGGWLAKVEPSTFTMIEKHVFNSPIGFTGQGLFSDYNHLYFINGNNITGDADIKNVNRITVMNFEGKFIKQIYSAFPLEMEEGDILDDVLYICSNSTHCALIVQHDLYCRNRECSFGRIYENVEVNNIPINVYVNEGNYSFYMDGATPAKGLSSIAWVTIWLRNSTTRINLYMESDITQLNKLSIRKYPNTVLSIDGQNHLMPNLLLESMDDCYINNCIFPGITGSSEFTIEYHGSRLAVNSCSFGTINKVDPNDPSTWILSTVKPGRLIYSTSPYEIDGIEINQDATIMFYMLADGFLRSVTMNHSSTNYDMLLNNCIADSSFPINSIRRNLYRVTTQIGFAPANGSTLNYNRLKYPCRILTSGNSTITNLPAGETDTNIQMISVESWGVNNVIIKLYHNDHTYNEYFS